jgi:cysteine desulfurase/selenocysteine lyase
MNNFSSENIATLFPFFEKRKKNIIYFDNAATTQKPNVVINSISDFYITSNSNIHRSSHNLGFTATEKYEAARSLIAQFISAEKSSEIILTSGATESINLAANSFGQKNLKKDDVILISEIEHHSNILPWQRLAKESGAVIQKIPLQPDLTIDLDKLKSLFNNSVKLLVVHHVSNVTGLMQNVKMIVEEAQKFNIPVFVDGAQAPAHIKVDVKNLNCDFYCFSGHKVFGPTGTGVLYVKEEHLINMQPYKVGGQMVSKVSFSSPEWSEFPLKFEAGTPNIAGVIGLASAIKFLQDIGPGNILDLEKKLTTHMCDKLQEIPGLTIYGSYNRAAPIFSFNVVGIHHSDLDTLFAENNILVRSGHLCNQGLMNYLNIDGCLRVSLAFYNTVEEIDEFILVLKKILSLLNKSS